MSKRDEKNRKAEPGEAQASLENSSDTLKQKGESTPNLNSDMDPVQELDTLRKDLDEARRKADDNFEGWQRERADFANYKRRIEREQVQTTQSITGSVIKKYLVVLDDMERALKARPAQGEEAAWADGVELIYRKLQGILDSEGIVLIDANGGQFDPTRHEAITYEEHPDFQSGEIIEIVQQGYMLGDRVLRPALVRVAR